MFFCLIVFPWLPTDKYNAFIRIFVFIGDIEFFFFFFFWLNQILLTKFFTDGYKLKRKKKNSHIKYRKGSAK